MKTFPVEVIEPGAISDVPPARCHGCRHWSQYGPDRGECNGLDIAFGARIVTQPDFGCVAWEAKPEAEA